MTQSQTQNEKTKNEKLDAMRPRFLLAACAAALLAGHAAALQVRPRVSCREEKVGGKAGRCARPAALECDDAGATWAAPFTPVAT